MAAEKKQRKNKDGGFCDHFRVKNKGKINAKDIMNKITLHIVKIPKYS